MRFGAGHVDVGGGADGLDHRVQVVERDLQAFQDVRALLALSSSNWVRRRIDLAPVVEEVLSIRFRPQRLRLAVDQRQHVDAEAGLHGGVLVQLVQDGVRRCRRA